MNEKEVNKYKAKYEQLKKEKFAILNLVQGEQVKHCRDEKIKYNKFRWLVTSEGRIWSLSHNKWLNPRNQRGYWRVANVYVHELVNHYFLTSEDENCIKVVNEHNSKCNNTSEIWHLDVHHLNPVEELDSSILTKEQRIQACMRVNNKVNLKYQIKELDHHDMHKLLKGKKTKGEEQGIEQFDGFTSVIKNSCLNTVYVSYAEDGKKQINMTVKLKGTTAEEEKELDSKIINRMMF